MQLVGNILVGALCTYNIVSFGFGELFGSMGAISMKNFFFFLFLFWCAMWLMSAIGPEMTGVG